MNQPERTSPWWIGAGIGVASAAVALGAAELVAATTRSLRSPIVDVGDRVIDLAPGWVKDFAITTFGQNDKLALLIGIAVLVVVYSAAIGIVATRRGIGWGITGIGVFGILGVAAADGLGGAVPTVVGSIAGSITLVFLFRLQSAPTAEDPLDNHPTDDRRRTLIGIGAATVVAVAAGGTGVALSRRFDITADIASRSLPVVARPLPPLPASVEAGVPGIAPFTTPNADFYRVDTALIVPQVPTDDYRLRIHGLVDREVVLTYDELTGLRQIESDITLTCVSNEVGGRLVGNARWQGVPLSDLLDAAGVQPAADQVVGRSVDGYTCGFPVDIALDGRDALVAIGMNGRPLPSRHGFPARLVVPGLYGYVSATKWLTEIELTRFDAFDQYWVPRGWDALAPIKTQSRIDTPGAFTDIPLGPAVIGGVAWAQTRGIERVEVRVDDGPWRTASLADVPTDTTWRQWSVPWDVTPGRHSLQCRATDGTGFTQPEERSRPKPNGASGWHTVVVNGRAA